MAPASPNPLRFAPSILAADHAALAEGLDVVGELPIQWVHLDIMDGHFVPNFSFGPQTVADLRKRNKNLFFDTHLMLDNPDKHIDAFIDAGSDLVSIHIEPDYDVDATLDRIKAAGCQNGIVLNPATPAEAALPFIHKVDLILIMSVWPGFGGQSFIEDTLPKMGLLHEWRETRGLNFRLEVDGGVDLKTAPLCREQGVDTFVAGTAFFKAPDRSAFVQAIEQE